MFDKSRTADLQLHKLEALGHFAGGIAHDFNNILSIIEGYATRSLRQLAAGDPDPELLQKILLSTERGAGLTRQLLAFARQNVDLAASVDLADELSRLHVLLRPLLGENIVFALSCPPGVHRARISADQLTQVVLNLAINARDAMSGQGDFRVSLRMVASAEVPSTLQVRAQDAGYLCLSVSDNGAGIAPEDIPHIFDPFFTTKRNAESGGTGLGLSVVYGIVDQVGGMVDVHTVVGRGTRFDIYLPLVVETPMAETQTAALRMGALAGRTVLLAEDEPELRDVLALMLEDMEMKVLPAANANEALRMQTDFEGEIDFLLTDIVMPGMDGVQLSDLFISQRPEANVVLMSGYPFLEAGKPLHVPEGADFISKPFRGAKIRQILERALIRKAERLQRGSVEETDEIPPA